MFGEGLPRTLSGYDLRCAPAAGRQKFRHLGRSGPAFLKRSPIPPPPSPFLHHPSSITLPPSPFLIDVRGGAARAPGAGVGGQRSHGWRSAANFERAKGPEGRSERPVMGHGQSRTLSDMQAPWRLGCGTALVSSLVRSRSVLTKSSPTPPPLSPVLIDVRGVGITYSVEQGCVLPEGRASSPPAPRRRGPPTVAARLPRG